MTRTSESVDAAFAATGRKSSHSVQDNCVEVVVLTK